MENLKKEEIIIKICKILGFTIKTGESDEIYEKIYTLADGSKYSICVNISVEGGQINYGKDIKFGRKTTQNFSEKENGVILECVDRLIIKGYLPKNIVLEYPFTVGHSTKWLDILVKRNDGKAYMMIECKTFGKEYDSALNKLIKNTNSGKKNDSNQLISYFAQDRNADIILIYSSYIVNENIKYIYDMIYTENLKQCKSATEIFDAWNKSTLNTGIFEDDILPYKYYNKKKRSSLKPLTQELSSKIFNTFLEILRKHGISDKPNAFNKILNLFLCKIVDEQKNNDEIVEFYWDEATTYNSMQNTLMSLYRRGMQDFLQIDIYEQESNNIYKKLDTLGVPKEEIDNICKIFNETKLYKSSEFAFKDIYNEETFIDNAEVIKEIIILLQNYQFRYGHKHQFLGVFFENLLATSIKQEVGQFFTPVPIARFMISSIPLEERLNEKINKCKNPNKTNTLMPTICDYSCGSGHFLTEFMDIAQKVIDNFNTDKIGNISVQKKFECFKSTKNGEFVWVDDCVYGIEKDYRLVKTTKISTFLNGDGDAKIIHADGLTEFGEGRFKEYELLKKQNQFDYVIANPPYSVDGFKYELTNTNFTIYKSLTENSKEIECLFIERTAQLLKDDGIAAIVLPTSIISNNGIHEDARENIIKHFYICGIVKMGTNTFMATKVETVILFLKKRPIEHYENAKILVTKFMNDYKDFSYNENLEIIRKYAETYNLNFEDYISILKENPTNSAKESDYYKLKCNFINEKNKSKLNEEEKLIDFILSKGNTTIIVNTGEKDAEKKFLGYYFSSRKRQEGLHKFNEGSMLYGESKNGSVDLENDIQKVNYYIREAFKGRDVDNFIVDECLKNNVNITTQENLFDFSKGNKININPIIKYYSKYDCKYIYTLCEKLESGNRPNGGRTNLTSGVISIGGENINTNSMLDLSKYSYVSEEYYNKQKKGKIFKGDILINKDGACTGKLARYDLEDKALSNEHCFVVNFGELQDYMYYLLQHSIYTKMMFKVSELKTAQPGLNIEEFSNIKVPIPPKDIRKYIIKECSNVDDEVKKALMEIKKYESEIVNIINDIVGNKVSLGDVNYFFVRAGGDAPEDKKYKPDTEYIIPIYSNGTKEKALYGYAKPSKKDVQRDAVSISARGSIGFVALRKAPFLPIGRLIYIYPIDTIDIEFIRLMLSYKNKNIKSSGSIIKQLTIPMVKDIYITLPEYTKQKEVVNRCLCIEEKINIAQNIIDTARERKDIILNNYLTNSFNEKI